MTEEQLQAIRDRAQAATPGPWEWHGNVDSHNLRLATWNRRKGHGEYTVMDFVRHGMQGAQPRFINERSCMDKASDDPMPVYQVCPTCTDRKDQRVYRGDIVGLRHPDAEFIAAAPQDVQDLLAHIRHQEAQIEALRAHVRGLAVSLGEDDV